MSTIPYVVDERTGIAIVQPSGLRAPHMTGIGTITYRCHSCGELIPKWYEVFYFDPAGGWAGYLCPEPMPATITTHHDWHMQET